MVAGGGGVVVASAVVAGGGGAVVAAGGVVVVVAVAVVVVDVVGMGWGVVTVVVVVVAGWGVVTVVVGGGVTVVGRWAVAMVGRRAADLAAGVVGDYLECIGAAVVELQRVHGVLELVNGLSAEGPVARTVGVLVVVVAAGSAAVVHLGRVSRFNGLVVGCARKSGWNRGRLESKRRCSYAVLGFISAAAALAFGPAARFSDTERVRFRLTGVAVSGLGLRHRVSS